MGRPQPFEAPARVWRPDPASLERIADDEELVAGRRPVEEAFAARRETRRLLVVPERRMALEAIVLHATTLRIPVVEVEGGSLTALAGFDGHQGVALVVAPRIWATLDDIVARAAERGQPPLVLILDSLEDPQNVGTLLRTAEACGVHGVLFPTRRQAPLSPAAIKASAGAVEHLLLCPVDDLAGALVDLRGQGLRLIGADEDAALSYREADLRGPLALVVGSEAHGLSGAVRRRLDGIVRLPMHDRISSLNASVAGSVLLFEAASQRDVASGEDAPGPRHGEPSGGVVVVEDLEPAVMEATSPEASSALKPKRTRATASTSAKTSITRVTEEAFAQPKPKRSAAQSAAATAAPAEAEPKPKRSTAKSAAAPAAPAEAEPKPKRSTAKSASAPAASAVSAEVAPNRKRSAAKPVTTTVTQEAAGTSNSDAKPRRRRTTTVTPADSTDDVLPA
ncbi:MAG: 23S rRNA (guanosine(2251)-2'-O)-methyltransferase RlmB [Candidatus Limnocylindrales bacterium]